MDSKKNCGDEVATLRERVKELSCLYAIAQISGRLAATPDEIMQGIADALPAAWQEPGRATARVVFDGAEFCSGLYSASSCELVSPIIVQDEYRGAVAVGYPYAEPDGGGCFLEEEKRLLDEVARQIGLVVDRREADDEQESLHTRLRHADRLATIGQLAAGVAHELNEPLGGILGFAQLLAKNPGLSEQAKEDIAKIEAAALHARDTIRRLMTFAHQTPPRESGVDLNRLILESEAIWGPRCTASGIYFEYTPGDGISEITADSGQLRQVITNLAVNAVQAMPDGGVLRIRTLMEGSWLQMSVQDNGTGIPREVLPRIFDPFFTTKDVDEGTGLGLSVVHGIVTGHGGSISVESAPGCGTVVTVRLPLHRPPHTGETNGQKRVRNSFSGG